MTACPLRSGFNLKVCMSPKAKENLSSRNRAVRYLCRSQLIITARYPGSRILGLYNLDPVSRAVRTFPSNKFIRRRLHGMTDFLHFKGGSQL